MATLRARARLTMASRSAGSMSASRSTNASEESNCTGRGPSHALDGNDRVTLPPPPLLLLLLLLLLLVMDEEEQVDVRDVSLIMDSSVPVLMVVVL